jgi:hypothetical protein
VSSDRTMTSEKPTEGKPEPVAPPLSMKELAAVLVKHYELTAALINPAKPKRARKVGR